MEDGERLPVAQEPLLGLCWRRCSAFRTDHTARGCAVVIHLALSIASTAGCRVRRRREKQTSKDLHEQRRVLEP